MRWQTRSWLLANLAITAALALVLGAFVWPHLSRWRIRNEILAHLIDKDLHTRELALNELIRHADDDVLIGRAAGIIPDCASDNALQLLNALREAGALSDERVVRAAATRMGRSDYFHMQGVYRVFIHDDRGDHPELSAAVIAQIPESPDKAFLELVATLQSAGQWRCPPVASEMYFRWIQVLGTHDTPSARKQAAERAIDVPDLFSNQRFLDLFGSWIDDQAPAVRTAALKTLAQLAGDQKSRAPHLALIARATVDATSATARQAWILLGLLNAVPNTNAVVIDPRPEVAEAMIWAIAMPDDKFVKTVQHLPDDGRQRLAAMQAYTMATRSTAPSTVHIVETLEAYRSRLDSALQDETTQTMLWRLLLALKAMPREAPPASHRQLFKTYQGNRLADRDIPVLSLIATHCDPKSFLDEHDPDTVHPLLWLAAVEGLDAGRRAPRATDRTPPLSRLITASIAHDVQRRDFYPALEAGDAALRDLACLVAADRLSRDEVDRLVIDLLDDFNDNAKRSGAILAGLTGANRDRLHDKMIHEDMEPVRQIHRLGMWMQHHAVTDESGQTINMRQLCSSLLLREDLPPTTILLAMLHVGRMNWDVTQDALGHILDRRHGGELELIYLLAERRWWYVLERYLPTGAPPFWVWADPSLQDFQIEVLGNWWQLTRNE